METTKDKIIMIVRQYAQMFPGEYVATKKIVKQKRDLLIKPTGNMMKRSKTLYRPAREIPVRLNNILMTRLTPEEWVWWNSKEGLRWSMAKLVDFCSVENI